MPRNLVIRQLAPYELEQRTHVQSRAVVCSDKGDWLFASARVRHTNYGGLLDSRKAIDHLFDFPRINVDTIYDQHVLLAIRNEEVAVSVPMPDVACVKPPV